MHTMVASSCSTKTPARSRACARVRAQRTHRFTCTLVLYLHHAEPKKKSGTPSLTSTLLTPTEPCYKTLSDPHMTHTWFMLRKKPPSPSPSPSPTQTPTWSAKRHACTCFAGVVQPLLTGVVAHYCLLYLIHRLALLTRRCVFDPLLPSLCVCVCVCVCPFLAPSLSSSLLDDSDCYNDAPATSILAIMSSNAGDVCYVKWPSRRLRVHGH
jgi:hypothetical protein